jgi:hypothetical protein
MLRTSPHNVSYLINRLKSASPKYFRSYPHPVTGSFNQAIQASAPLGRPPAVYYLNIEWVISLPQTAFIALEALRLSYKPRALRRAIFITRMARQHRLSKQVVEERLTFCVKNSYLALTKDTDVVYRSPSDRIRAESTYLSMLANDYSTAVGKKKGAAA